jgi:hypothetical protein
MRQPVETGRQENPISPERFERVLSVGTRLRGRHYGQRSCAPHQQVEHTAAPTSQTELRRKPLPTGSRPHTAKNGTLALGLFTHGNATFKARRIGAHVYQQAAAE